MKFPWGTSCSNSPSHTGLRKGELLGHAHIGVTAIVYAHVRIRLQRDAIDTLSAALSNSASKPPCAASVR
ncbi:hypothetical protein [Streptomyces sp. TR06-5]|uniref:hypothetical protein n=1 Tax=unclassified Streptomyces TaxID=2593676 RepID=UPI0039A0718C